MVAYFKWHVVCYLLGKLLPKSNLDIDILHNIAYHPILNDATDQTSNFTINQAEHSAKVQGKM